MNSEQKFSVLAECKEQSDPLIMVNLNFARLIDDIVKPFQSDEPFFIDGVPLKRDSLKKIKIVKQTNLFNSEFYNMNSNLRRADSQKQKVIGDQYYLRVEALLRELGEDVTSQIIKAFDTEIKPRLKDYLPNRKELIEAALQVFLKGMQALGGT